jgi:Carboxypeptidase regulatory-like domain
MRPKHLLFLLFVLCAAPLWAQVTTSALSGKVADAKGQGLPGATVVALHTPSGTKYATATQEGGRYVLANMRVGGPYQVTVTFMGYQAEKAEGVFLALGERASQSFVLKEASNTLDAVTVKANGIINSNRTGMATSIGSEQLNNLPTITRSTADYIRLNPMVAEGGSIAGRNDQFNNYSLDGAIFNNPFGLDSSTPGGQADAQPVSLDAIEQLSVQIAPYDVTQAGFTGASVNAVTKSGTNDFKGTVFGFYRNQDLVGRKVNDVNLPKLDLSQTQFGFSVGGPLIKNKLFFFFNAEFDRRSDVGSPFVPSGLGSTGENVSRVAAADMLLVSSLLKQIHNYDTGQASGFALGTQNQKGILKLDWNINENHNLSFTYNFLDAFKEKPAHPSAIGRRGPDALTLQFRNSGYRINNRINGGILELKSQVAGIAANKLQIGYTSFDDSRDPFSAPFPVLNISKGGVRYIVAGHEPFSINNKLGQSVFQITNNFNLFLDKHTLTIGSSLERFSFDNSFNLTGYGARVFFPDVPIEDFPAFVASADFAKEVSDARAAFTRNNANNSWALAQTIVGQWGWYFQDEMSLSDRFNLTLGVRMDMPLYFNTKEKIQENIGRNQGVYLPDITYYDEQGAPVKFDHTVLPTQTPLFSPRVGFNYDIKGDKTQQLRGGSGLFTGRFPFVWIGNQVANPAFFFYCVTAPDFKFPQVWRTNVGYDHKFANGWVASVDAMYTKDINATMVRNYGLRLPSARLQGADTRPIYAASDRATVFGGPTNAYVFSNTSVGYSFNLSAQLERTFANGLYVKMGYNYLDAVDAASIDAEISSDAYDRNPANITHTNTPLAAPSLYGNRHRLLFVGAKTFTYSAGRMATTVSLFGEYAQGGRYSFTYAGDINNDGSGLNDLVYIPTSAQVEAMRFTGTAAQQATQRTALARYIANDAYLSANQGKYAEKYASLAPWYSNWDMRVLQDFNFKNGHKIQLSMDILNVGNLISSSWGVRQWAGETGLVQPLAVSVANGTPTYTFDTNQTSSLQTRFDLLSRWRMQFGVRYRF